MTKGDETKKFQDMAKKAYICRRQLDELRKTLQNTERFSAPWSLIDSYNKLLTEVKEILSIDPAFSSLIGYLKEDNGQGISVQISHRILLHVNILIGALGSFIQLYLSPEDKKKIGF